MTGTLGLNLLDSCDRTSASRGWCFNIFLIFMIRTIAACKINKVKLSFQLTAQNNDTIPRVFLTKNPL